MTHSTLHDFFFSRVPPLSAFWHTSSEISQNATMLSRPISKSHSPAPEPAGNKQPTVARGVAIELSVLTSTQYVSVGYAVNSAAGYSLFTCSDATHQRRTRHSVDGAAVRLLEYLLRLGTQHTRWPDRSMAHQNDPRRLPGGSQGRDTPPRPSGQHGRGTRPAFWRWSWAPARERELKPRWEVLTDLLTRAQPPTATR